MIIHPEETTVTSGNSQIKVGMFTYGHEKIRIKEWGEGASLTIGNFCSIAKGVTIFLGGNHRTDWITTFPFGHIFRKELGGQHIKGHPSTKGDVNIGNDVWIGSGVTIMSGITIGNGAVIAANATVVKDVDPYEIVAGNPGKHVKFRFDKEIINLLLTLEWWQLPIEDIKTLAEKISQPPSKELLYNLLSKYRND